jgi:hypothetical protein
MKITAVLSGLFFAMTLTFFLAVAYLPVFSIPTQSLTLEFEAQASSPLEAVLLHDIRNEGRLWPEDYTSFRINPSTNFATYRFELPKLPIRFLRIDISGHTGMITFQNIRILDSNATTLITIPPGKVESINMATTIHTENGQFTATWNTPNAQPSLWMNTPYPVRPARSRAPVTAGAVITLLAILAGLALSGVWLVISAFRRDRRTVASPDSESWHRAVLWIASTLLIILGAKFSLMSVYGNSIPCWDSWEFEGWACLAPFRDGNLAWAVLIEPLNEHRVFFSRVLSLGLLLANGRWDELVGMSANVILHTLTAAGLCLLLWRFSGRRYIVPICILALMIFALPFSWENVLRASQSQFYFSVGFTIAAIWLLTRHRPLSARWWTGLTLSLFAVFSLSAGLLAICAVIGLCVLRIIRNPAEWKTRMITLCAGGVVLGSGLLFSVEEKAHAGWQARNASDFSLSLMRTGSWPLTDHPWLAPILWLPFILLLVYYLRRTEERHMAVIETVLALGIWAALQVVTFALYRGAGGGVPESRHADSMSVCIVVNGMAGILLIPRTALWKGIGGLWKWFVPAWWALASMGMISLSARGLFHEAPTWKDLTDRATAAVRFFLQTDSIQQWMGVPEDSMPYVRYVMPSFLRNPQLRAILPYSLTPPMPVTPRPSGGTDFITAVQAPGTPVQRFLPTWGSYFGTQQTSMIAFVSQPIPAPNQPYLAFLVTGDLGEPNLSLTLRTASSKNGIVLRPSSPPHTKWKTLVVRSPGEPFVIEAIDANGGKSFAFSAPLPMTRLSAWTQILVSKAHWMLYSGISLIVMLLMIPFARRLCNAAAPLSSTKPGKR